MSLCNLEPQTACLLTLCLPESMVLNSPFVYLVMLEFRPPQRPLSDVTATVTCLLAGKAAKGQDKGQI